MANYKNEKRRVDIQPILETAEVKTVEEFPLPVRGLGSSRIYDRFLDGEVYFIPHEDGYIRQRIERGIRSAAMSLHPKRKHVKIRVTSTGVWVHADADWDPKVHGRKKAW